MTLGRWIPVAGCAALLWGCGPSVSAALSTSGCGNPDQGFVLGALALTNHGGGTATLRNPVYWRGLIVTSTTGSVLRHDLPPSSQTDQQALGPAVIASGQSWTTGLAIWDRQIDNLPAPAGTYGLQVDLTDGPTTQVTWVALPSCSATTVTP